MMKFLCINKVTQLSRYLWLVLMLVAIATPSKCWSFSTDLVHHQLRVELEPSSRFAKIEDRIQFKTSKNNCEPFYLHAALKLDPVPAGWQVKSSGEPGLNTIELINSGACPETLTLNYSGVLHDPSLESEDSADSSGFFFSGASYFYLQSQAISPRVTFNMQVSLPESWQSVSQGQRSHDAVVEGRRLVTWKSSRPSEEIYLIGNRFHVFEAEHKGLSFYAFLLVEEQELADRYLQTAKAYIDFYSKLIGSYPYEKFALVENSQQTGYGMPSFTLMGSRIIRFPFILHSSYPHEILHNWWGNGVFPKLSEGNWSEGLTAYLADHLLLELKGKGAQYRFQEMMKFSNYVNEQNDFPLAEFGYRDSMASQAIGYAKLLMVFHMLRTEVGAENFVQGLRKFYGAYKYRYAGYEELRKSFEQVSGQNLTEFFEQWVHRKGAPEIHLKKASYVTSKDRYDLTVTVGQALPAFQLKLPIAIWTSNSPIAEIHTIDLVAGKQDFHFQLSAEPMAVRLDPYHDVFRLPGDEEAPASLSQTYGATNVIALLPAQEAENHGYTKFAQAVAKPENILDKTNNYPEGSLWVFGRNHPLRKSLTGELQKLGIKLEEQGVHFSDNTYPWKNHSFVFTLRRTDGKKGTMTWVIADKSESIPGLIRKLPHYGKYSYLVFEGSAPDNRYRGVWSTNPRELEKVFHDEKLRHLPEQKPLVSFKPFR